MSNIIHAECGATYGRLAALRMREAIECAFFECEETHHLPILYVILPSGDAIVLTNEEIEPWLNAMEITT
jgi:hypothetical protein